MLIIEAFILHAMPACVEQGCGVYSTMMIICGCEGNSTCSDPNLNFRPLERFAVLDCALDPTGSLSKKELDRAHRDALSHNEDPTGWCYYPPGFMHGFIVVYRTPKVPSPMFHARRTTCPATFAHEGSEDEASLLLLVHDLVEALQSTLRFSKARLQEPG